MSVSPAVTTLCENSNDVFLEVTRLLIAYADNILRYPTEEKYRRIRVGNPNFSTKLLPVRGAVECLFEMGFEEDETHLVFPKSASLKQLLLVRDCIAAERDQRLRGGHPVQRAAQPAEAPALASDTDEPAVLPWLSNQVGSMNFCGTLATNLDHVLLYESLDLQQKARNCIPHQELLSAAQRKLNEAKEADPECKLGIEDFLVLELLRWFKADFFTWVDLLPCNRCGGRTRIASPLFPSADEARWGANQVEIHYCDKCQLSIRFPRYNHPEKLLETRKGRCGEWANCFTLCCRAIGLEARYIWDSTDHVWTEVYSVSQRRWLHCDACENVCDKPLLYEVGWGKNLAYIMAFSKDEVVDVTWRYSCKHEEVLKRRTRVQEAFLLRAINELNAKRQQFLNPERKMELTERLLVELVEFISPKTPKAGELGGRNSGSLAWRLARGETREVDEKASAQVAGFLFVPTESEKRDKLLHLRYSASKDQYCRVSNGSEIVHGWDKCVWKKESIFRKVEQDWQMAYLARTEGCSTGTISWRFAFAPAGLKIKSIFIMATSKTFNSGKAYWHMQSGEYTKNFTGDGQLLSFSSFSGSSELLIAAELSGGDGEVAWQHAQLFRQSLGEMDEASFEIIIYLQDV